MFASVYARFNRTFTRKIVAMVIFGVLAIYKQKPVKLSKMVKERLTSNQEHLRIRIGRFINFVNRVSRKFAHRTNGWVNRVEFFYTYSLVNGLCFGYFQFFLRALKNAGKNHSHYYFLVTPRRQDGNIWKT